MNQNDEEYKIRFLNETDFEKGYLSLVTKMCHVEIQMDLNTFEQKLKQTNGVTLVIENSDGKLVGHGSVFYQKKVHYEKMVGYIEDIFVDDSLRGKRLGSRLIDELTQLATKAGCYKVTLCCYSHIAPFYFHCGYEQTGVEMRKRLE